jgi:murein DD-endopeptidase MepM/ murein hydrolase activator NlpD
MLHTLLFATTYSYILLFSLFGKPIFENKSEQEKRTTASLPENNQYGVNLNLYDVREESIEKNESLAEILLRHNVASGKINLLQKKSKGIFNFNKIRSGNNYLVLGKESINGFIPKKFIYQEDRINYIVFNLDGSLNLVKGSHKIDKRMREVGGSIKGSLYETFDRFDINPALAVYLSEIFSCTVDFYKIHEGDRFKIVFEEQFVNGESVGVGQISSAMFSSNGKDFYAFRFEKDNKVGYYDEEGNSMRKQFLKSPVKFARISSRFSKSRLHPVTKVRKAHLGTDYAAAHGTPILATADGIIEEACKGRFNGNYVKIRHNGHYKTQYLHMSRIGKGMRRGKKVQQGQVIGYVGSTGLATGPHVCYRFWKDGKQVDPHKQTLKFSEPINARYKAEFASNLNLQKKKLDKLACNPAPEYKTEKIKIDKKLFVANYMFKKHF